MFVHKADPHFHKQLASPGPLPSALAQPGENKHPTPEPPPVPSSFASGLRARVRLCAGAQGAGASGPCGRSPGSPPPPGLSSRRRLCPDRLLFPWLRPARPLAGCQLGREGRGEPGRRMGREGGTRPRFSRGHAGPGAQSRGPGRPTRAGVGVQGGRRGPRCGDAGRPGRAFREAGMQRFPARSWSWCVSLSSGRRGSS